ncbi:DUF4145 domain-containing protein [Mesorhizobium muleiense]|uniref:DUF4145 domain-containing protein n=1 Tax=Mesorhizobium muleiense TaxID=1004279 RepID=UPI001F346106|nr:DUF4145 domain-containing protein [Mesorhizobium muleiense]MCF6113879.1 DUF4145 domain-containing protein [Mesorhizobium muleiense]
MPAKYIAPSPSLTGFNCPHCGVLTSQFWSNAYARMLPNDGDTPTFWSMEAAEAAFKDLDDETIGNEMAAFVKKAASGMPFFEKTSDGAHLLTYNVNFSNCFECNKISIWIYGKLIWPSANEAPDANADLPDDVRADYDEAGLVLSTSPRSAAALLRQAVQRLCKHLGGKGKNIDDDIALLVRNGLDPRVQKALDVVRVVGNNAVHPGQIDLKDDRPTAEKLFGLVNLIADIMVTQPKHINAMFEGLPEGVRKAIEKRDAPKQIEDKSAE